MVTADTVIAGSALALALYGIHATNRHNRLSVTPHLVGSQSINRRDDGVIFAYDICNHGIGPAKIKSFALLLDGKPFSCAKGNRVEEFIAARVAGKLDYKLLTASCPNKEYSILAGQVYRVVEVFIPEVTRADDEKIGTVFKGMDLRVEYESFYGKRDVFDTRN